MNSLKSLFFIAVLAAAALGVYVSLNRNPESAIPEGMGLSAAATASGGVNVSLPDFGTTPSPAPAAGLGPVAAAPNASASGTAPLFGPAGAGTTALAEAPAFAGPTPATMTSAPPFASMPVGPTATAPSAPAAGPTANSSAAPLAAPPFGPGEGPIFPGAPAVSAPAATTVTAATGSGSLAARNAALQDRAAQIRMESVMQGVESKVAEGKWADAHLLLSSVYGDRNVTPEQSQQLTRLLDQMAARVVYSREHALENPYEVKPGDTLDQIADQYGVPALLLQRINGIRDPNHLAPGKQLKVLRGPFSALLDFDHQELTLMVKGRYAGRFAIIASDEVPRTQATYAVARKWVDQESNLAPPAGFGMAAAPAPAAPAVGKPCIDLDNQVKIRGVSDPSRVGRTGGRGTICLSERDMNDIYGILSVQSRVTVLR